MWNHMQPHLYNNETHLEYEMTLNKAFAEVSFVGHSVLLRIIVIVIIQ